MPSGSPITEVARLLGGEIEVRAVPIPHDCTDGFLCAYWRRPEAFFDPDVRAGISSFALLPTEVVEEGLARLRADLESGAFWTQNVGLQESVAFDLGYRVLVA